MQHISPLNCYEQKNKLREKKKRNHLVAEFPNGFQHFSFESSNLHRKKTTKKHETHVPGKSQSACGGLASLCGPTQVGSRLLPSRNKRKKQTERRKKKQQKNNPTPAEFDMLMRALFKVCPPSPTPALRC